MQQLAQLTAQDWQELARLTPQERQELAQLTTQERQELAQLTTQEREALLTAQQGQELQQFVNNQQADLPGPISAPGVPSAGGVASPVGDWTFDALTVDGKTIGGGSAFLRVDQGGKSDVGLGCNARASGSFQDSRAFFHVSPVITKRWCHSEGIMAFEAALIDFLNGDFTYEIVGDKLTLAKANGDHATLTALKAANIPAK